MKNDYVGILNSCSTGRDITGFTHYDIDAKQVIKLLEHYKANNPLSSEAVKLCNPGCKRKDK